MDKILVNTQGGQQLLTARHPLIEKLRFTLDEKYSGWKCFRLNKRTAEVKSRSDYEPMPNHRALYLLRYEYLDVEYPDWESFQIKRVI
jgi:hypothetical protein